MPFRLRHDAQKWFTHLKGQWPLEFDTYYFCLMAGLASRRKVSIPHSEATDLVDRFPGEYKHKGRLIVALFLSCELEALGIGTSEKEVLHRQISQLVDPLSPCHLSNSGLSLLNKYSHGGFEVLRGWFGDKPRKLETFLSLFKKRLDETLDESR